MPPCTMQREHASGLQSKFDERQSQRHHLKEAANEIRRGGSFRGERHHDTRCVVVGWRRAEKLRRVISQLRAALQERLGRQRCRRGDVRYGGDRAKNRIY